MAPKYAPNETEGLLHEVLVRSYHGRSSIVGSKGSTMVKVKSSQKIFTEEEISGLTGICREHLRDLAHSKHLGSLARAVGDVGEQAERRLFTNSDLTILAVLVPRCQH
jgi:hypothetical protein